MEIEVGEYVRTKDGSITKIKEFYKSGIFYSIVGEDGILYGNPKEVVKYHSPNIIDLIELGDYVNGYKVLDIAQAPKKALYLEDIRQNSALLPIEDIKTIVTKEQFEEMEYIV